MCWNFYNLCVKFVIWFLAYKIIINQHKADLFDLNQVI